MTQSEIEDYLYYEFNVLDKSELTKHNRIIAYERLRHKIITKDKPALDIAKDLIILNEYLEVEYE